MTLENQNVGADAQVGAGSTPSEPVSPQAQSPIDGNVAQLLTELGGKLDRFGNELRGLQGRQDKAETTQSDFRNQLARLNQYKSQGLSDSEALAEMEADDHANQRWQTFEQKLDQLAARIAGGGTQANGQQVNAAEVFGKILGQDALKNPMLAPVLAKQYASAAEAETEAYRVFYQLSTLPNPNPAQSASLQGGNTGAVNYDALAAEYDSLAINPSLNFERMTQIQTELDTLK